MFTLELFNLISEYKNAIEYDRERIIQSIKNLIKQYPGDFESFMTTQRIDPAIKAFLTNCASQIGEDVSEERMDDIETIKNAYNQWLTIYNSGNNNVSQKNIEICQILIEKYFDTKYPVIEKLLKIEQGPEYEIFKNMILNILRSKYASLLEQYIDSEPYRNLGFFARLKKKRQIKDMIDYLEEYKFDINKLRGILNN
jgi:DNA polymerase/3'-5' exonuclease PolX